MDHKEFEFTFHEATFYGQSWQDKNPEAVVLLIHGMGEHSGRYSNYVVPQLTKAGLAVISYDQFGHGKTTGKRGHNPGFKELLDCISVVAEKALDFFGTLPIFLYGHSMGGNLVINYLLKRENNFIGAIATSPFLKLAFEPPSWKLSLAKYLQKIIPSLTMSSELEVAAISRIPEEVQKYKDDPLNHDKISPNYSLTIINSGLWALDHAKDLKQPLFIVHGSADRITSHKASREFAEGNNFASIKLFKGGYHELHNDICKDEMNSSIISWIKKQLEINAN